MRFAILYVSEGVLMDKMINIDLDFYLSKNALINEKTYHLSHYVFTDRIVMKLFKLNFFANIEIVTLSFKKHFKSLQAIKKLEIPLIVTHTLS